MLLYWIPLGAGGHVVRWNGRVYEALAARRERRRRCDLYHTALVVHTDGDRFTLESAPAWADRHRAHGAVLSGPVGTRLLGRSVLFRYEVRCWREGVISDLSEAVASPVLVGQDAGLAQRLLDAVAQVPALTWGRDELGTGEMWNSNSLVSWLLARSGHDTAGLAPPAHGRAPGWTAGLVLAARQAAEADHPPGG